MAMLKYVLCFAILAVSFKNVRAVSEEDKSKIRESFLPFMVECSKEHGVSSDAVSQAKTEGDIDGIDKCFIACVFKKAKVMDDSGLIDFENAIELAKNILNSEESTKKASEIADACKSVNDEQVGDGEAGCERAKLMLTCFVQHMKAEQ